MKVAVKRRRRGGFTWIEVMMAIVLVSLTASMFVALVPMAAQSQTLTGSYQQASSLVQHKVDQLRAVGYGRLNYTELHNAGIIDASPTTVPFKFKVADGLDAIYKNSTPTINITDWSTNIKQVTINLSWSGGASTQSNGNLVVTTLIAQD
ncbi:hypothetical protein BH11ARM1_BH11ARM1_02550 [soil metagenome]